MSLLTTEQRIIFDETIRLRHVDALNDGEEGLTVTHGHKGKLLPGQSGQKGASETHIPPPERAPSPVEPAVTHTPTPTPRTLATMKSHQDETLDVVFVSSTRRVRSRPARLSPRLVLLPRVPR